MPAFRNGKNYPWWFRWYHERQVKKMFADHFPKKKRSKLPIIILVVVVVLALVIISL